MLTVGASLGSFAYAATVSLISFSPYDLVDSGKHLDWDARGSIYINRVVDAAAKWNGYKSGVIRPDSILVVQDIYIYDVSLSGVAWGALTSLGSANMRLNKYYLEQSATTDLMRVQAITHEFGHALGLDHNQYGDMMYETLPLPSNLSANDKASYDAAYKRY